jgi:hypothetical protein
MRAGLLARPSHRATPMTYPLYRESPRPWPRASSRWKYDIQAVGSRSYTDIARDRQPHAPVRDGAFTTTLILVGHETAKADRRIADASGFEPYAPHARPLLSPNRLDRKLRCVTAVGSVLIAFGRSSLSALVRLRLLTTTRVLWSSRRGGLCGFGGHELSSSW